MEMEFLENHQNNAVFLILPTLWYLGVAKMCFLRKKFNFDFDKHFHSLKSPATCSRWISQSLSLFSGAFYRPDTATRGPKSSRAEQRLGQVGNVFPQMGCGVLRSQRWTLGPKFKAELGTHLLWVRSVKRRRRTKPRSV